MADSDDLLDMLRAKAMVLLRREREVHELRRERSRTETWLGVFQELPTELHAHSSITLLENWASAMVNNLGFQIAAVYEIEPSGRLQQRASLAHRDVPSSVDPSPLLAAHCLGNVYGCFPEPGQEPLESFAKAVGLDKFFWMTLSTPTTRLLLVTGFASVASPPQGHNEHDLGHFVYFGTHLSALLNNAALIGELDRERSELRASNLNLDTSLTELRETQSQLVESAKELAEVSRRAGMADIATGVLHNVGNALNSVNVSVQIVSERLQGLRVEGLGKVVALLEEKKLGEEGSLDPIQARRLVAYLRELHAHLVEERAGITNEVGTLNQHIDHINWVISKQQAYAKAVGFSEPCDVAQLVDDALEMAHDALSHQGIAVVRDFEDTPKIELDRHKALQILVNLVSNARHALTASPRRERRIVVSIRRADLDRIWIRVEDNGIGIHPEHLPKLFTHGFTTRKNGHGFGLHTSVLAAQQLGGTLTGTSDGPQKGATFTLELPVQPPQSPDHDAHDDV